MGDDELVFPLGSSDVPGKEARFPARQNPPAHLAQPALMRIRKMTRAALGIYSDQHHYADAIKKLTELEGFSLPIATLILAEYDSVNIPYFTEGIYIWLREEDARDRIWDRRMDYVNEAL